MLPCAAVRLQMSCLNSLSFLLPSILAEAVVLLQMGKLDFAYHPDRTWQSGMFHCLYGDQYLVDFCFQGVREKRLSSHGKSKTRRNRKGAHPMLGRNGFLIKYREEMSIRIGCEHHRKRNTLQSIAFTSTTVHTKSSNRPNRAPETESKTGSRIV